MLTRRQAPRVLVAVDDGVEDRAVTLRHLDQRVVGLGEAREPEVVEHLVDDVDDPGVAGAGQQAEMERAVEVEEDARVASPRRRDAGVDDLAQMCGVLGIERAGETGEHRDLDQRAQLQRGVEVGRGVLDDPEPAVSSSSASRTGVIETRIRVASAGAEWISPGAISP